MRQSQCLHELLAIQQQQQNRLARGDDRLSRIASGKLVHVEDVTGIDHLRQLMQKTGTVPDGRRISMFNNKIVSYELGGVTYVFGEKMDLVSDTYRAMGKEWAGQTFSALLWDLVEDVYGTNGLPKGRPNPEVRAVLAGEQVKGHAQCGLLPGFQDLDDILSSGPHSIMDISKCHAACMYAPAEDWGLPSLHDHIERFPPTRLRPSAKLGLYHVDSPAVNALMRRGTGWYTAALVRKAYDARLPFTCDAFIPTSTRLPKEFFRPLLHKFVEVSRGDESVYKELFNRLSGCSVAALL